MQESMINLGSSVVYIQLAAHVLFKSIEHTLIENLNHWTKEASIFMPKSQFQTSKNTNSKICPHLFTL
jgi:hypothetical protein